MPEARVICHDCGKDTTGLYYHGFDAKARCPLCIKKYARTRHKERIKSRDAVRS